MIKVKHNYNFIEQVYWQSLNVYLKYQMPKLSKTHKSELKKSVSTAIAKTDVKLIELEFKKGQMFVLVTKLQISTLEEQALSLMIQQIIDDFFWCNQLHPNFNDTNLIHNSLIKLNRLVSIIIKSPSDYIFGVQLDYFKKNQVNIIKMLQQEITVENHSKLHETAMIVVEHFSFYVTQNGEHCLVLNLTDKTKVQSTLKQIKNYNVITFLTLSNRAVTITVT